MTAGRLDVQLHVGPSGHRSGDTLDIGVGDVRIAPAEVELQRTCHLVDLADSRGHAGAVVTDGDVGIVVHGRQVRERPAEAEPEHPRFAARAVEQAQGGERVAKIGDARLGIERHSVAHALLEVVLVKG